MVIKLYWDTKDRATIVFEVGETVNPSDYAQKMQDLTTMVKERHEVGLIIVYPRNFSVHYDGFAALAKAFFIQMNEKGLWHVVVTSSNQSIIDLWQSTLGAYKIEPPTYSFSPTVEAGVEQIMTRRGA